MAYGICKNYDQAGDLVQEMYLRLYDIMLKHPEKELKETYVWVVMCNIQKTKWKRSEKYKEVSLDIIKDLPEDVNLFEVDDRDLELLDRSKELRYLYRYYLEQSYDKSLRELAEHNNVGYWIVNRRLEEARKHILKDDIHLYKNKRNKR